MFRRRRFKSPKIKKARRQRRIRFAILWGIVVLLLTLLSVQISQLSELSIKRVSIVGVQTTSRHDIFEEVTRVLSGRYVYLYPRGNIMLYPRGEIEQALLETFPRLRAVDTDIVSRNEIQVAVIERSPIGIACSDPDALEQFCYFLDGRGFVFAHAPVFSGTTRFMYQEVGKNDFTIGTHVLEPDVFEQLYELKLGLTRLGLSPAKLVVVREGDNPFAQNFTFVLREGTELIFSIDPTVFETEIQNLQAILASSEYREESGGDIGTIEYIDLRFGNKVFYLLKDGRESE